MADQFTLDVLSAGLDAAAIEMFEVLRKTAMSPIIYEVLDVGTGITDANGAMVSSGAGIPSFIGVLDKSVSAILAHMGTSIVDGDLFLTNDPNYGGVTHLNDIVVAEPVFFEGVIVAWVASIAHWGDIGGRTPGSMSTETAEIVAEGLRLPIVRLFSGGVRNEAVFDIICANSRLPEFVQGDLWAQVSAGRKAALIIRGLCGRYGAEALGAAISSAREVGVRRATAGLATLPKGKFSVEEPQDDGSVWKASVTISKDRFIVDLRNAPSEVLGPYNTGRDGAVVASQIFFKAMVDPDRFANAGSFTPLEVLTTPGTIFHAGPTAAHAYYFETRMKLIDMLWHCLATAMPDKLPAGHFASIFGTVISGTNPDTGRRYLMVEPQMGGWGATSKRAGQNAMFSTNHGDTFNCPVEIAEARYGFEVVQKVLIFGPTDRGLHPGGAGIKLQYRMRSSATLSTGYSHEKVPVWSLGDTRRGGLNALVIHRESDEPAHYHFASNVQLKACDIVELKTAYGGSAKPT